MAAAPTGPQSTRNRCVFVGNIPYDATEEQLVQICEEVGPVVSFRLVLDKETGKPKGYGFCEYKDDETALSARRNLQGYEINGRQLRVDFAENGKNADRNREQGRGGPGMASTVDVQKQLGGTSILRDSSLHQPIGLQPAIHAASVMAGALGGAQTAIVQNGLPVQYGLGNDPLTHYLARMSKHQLHEVMSELKSLATQNKELAKKLLQGIPQLPKALFQAQIMVGMTPQMMQMAKSQQTPSSFVQSSSHPSMTFPRPDATMQMLPRPPVSLPVNIPQNSAVPQESTVPVPQYQHPSHSQAEMFSHGHHSGVVTYPPVPSQPLGVPSSLPTQPLLTLRGSTSQVQSTFQPQHFEPPVVPTSVQQPLVPYAHLPQANSINAPFLVAAAHETLPKEVRLPGQANMLSHLPDSSHPSKLRKLDIGTSVPGMVNNDPTIYSTPSQAVISDGPSGSQCVGAITIQQPEKEMTPQLPPEVESSLLQQVLQLTQEQLNALPVEQRQQVIELQRMLSAGK